MYLKIITRAKLKRKKDRRDVEFSSDEYFSLAISRRKHLSDRFSGGYNRRALRMYQVVAVASYFRKNRKLRNPEATLLERERKKRGREGERASTNDALEKKKRLNN